VFIVFLRQAGAEGEEASAPPSVRVHAGGAAALQRSPFHDDVLFSAGAWTWAVWREGTSAPLLQSPAAPAQYSAAAWSPTRPGAAPVQLVSWHITQTSHMPVALPVSVQRPMRLIGRKAHMKLMQAQQSLVRTVLCD